MATVLTSRNHSITLKVGDIAIAGPWKTFTGGGIKSAGTFNRPGGMADRQAIGGVTERENVKITREFDYVRDAGLVGPGGLLDTAVEEGHPSVVMVQRLDANKRPVGDPKPYVGMIIVAED